MSLETGISSSTAARRWAGCWSASGPACGPRSVRNDGVGCFHRELQRSLPGVVLDVGVGAPLEQHGDDLAVAVLRREVNRQVAVSGARGDVGSLGQQLLDYFGVTPLAGHVQ